MTEETSNTTSEVIRLPKSRLSFPRIWKAKAFREGQKPRFESSFLIDPSSKAGAAKIKEIFAAAEGVIRAKFNGKIPKKLKFGFGYSDGRPFKIGGVEFNPGTDGVKDYDGYEDMFYVSSANKTRPVVVARDGRTPLTEEDGKPYGGCYVNGTITLWAQDNEYGQRVNANLRGMQFHSNGEAFGVKPVDAEEEFDEIEDLDDDAGPDDDNDWDD